MASMMPLGNKFYVRIQVIQSFEYSKIFQPLKYHCVFVCYMQQIVRKAYLVSIIRIIKNSQVSVLVVLLLSISVTYETLRINFVVKTRFCAGLRSYFTSLALDGTGLTNEKKN